MTDKELQSLKAELVEGVNRVIRPKEDYGPDGLMAVAEVLTGVTAAVCLKVAGLPLTPNLAIELADVAWDAMNDRLKVRGRN